MLVHVLAIIQAVALPGYVLWRAVRIPSRSLAEASLTILCLSALANFAAVSAATAIGVGVRAAAPWLIAAEVAFVVVDTVLRRRDTEAPDTQRARLRVAPLTLTTPVVIATVAGLGAATLLLVLAMRRYGAVFSEWDTVFSWNEWALDWVSGRFPNLTWLYPQLVPANWSLTYAILGSVEVQALPKALMAVYPVASGLMLVDLGARRGSAGRAAAAVLFGVVVWLGFAANVDSGAVDLAAGFFALGAFCTLPDPDHPFTPAGPREFVAPLAFAVASACAKQSGLLVLFVVCAVALRATIADARASRGHAAGRIAGVLAVPAAVAVGAYLPGYLSMPKGGVTTSYGGIAAAMGDASLLDRLAHAAGITVAQQPWLLLVAALVIAAAIRRRDLLVVTAIVVPWVLVWAVTLSYDFRNLAFALPLACFAAGSAFPSPEGRTPSLEGGVRRLPGAGADRWIGRAVAVAPIVAISLVSLVAVAFVVANGSSQSGLTRDQLERQGRIGSPDLNVELARLVGGRAARATILTDYRFLPQLPLYRSDPRRVTLAAGTATVYADSKDISTDDLARRPRFAVLTDAVTAPVETQIQALLRSGAYRLLGTFPGGPGNFGDARVRVLERVSTTGSGAP